MNAKIVSWSNGGAEVCASAARISTTPGDALELFEKAQNNPNNLNLIGKVIRSGHRSVMEHAVFSIALQNVSVFVEQYFIECRLASFTVKSRRYVDFSGQGCYVPPELEGEALRRYRLYMDSLFDAYRKLLDAEIPKEDARFVLPYAFCSNFYCTLNARELVELIRSIRYGRGRDIPELQAIAGQLTEQLGTLFPCLVPELERPGRTEPAETSAPLSGGEPVWVEAARAGAVEMLAALAVYRSALTEACHMAGELCQDPNLRPYSYYFAVAGNVMDVMTTLNARELKLIIRLRTCTRAQWEIRHIALGMLRRLRDHEPELFRRFGPSCYLTGECPEGRFSCGRQEEMRAFFSGDLT